MPETKDESSDAGKQKDPIFRNWTSGDSKLLIITIAATVAANTITVILVALAVIVARSMRPHPGAPGNYAFLFGFSIFPLLGVWLVLSFWRTSRRKRAADSVERVIKWVIIAVGIFEGFFALLYILALIGFATGLK